MKKKILKNVGEYADLLLTAEVISEPELIQYGEKQKQVFDIKAKTDKKLTCVSWETYPVDKGDVITVKGRLHYNTNHIVLFRNTGTVRSLLIIKKAENN